MAAPEEVALAFQEKQSALAAATAARVARQYDALDEHALSESWAAGGVGTRVQAAVESGQLAAAQAAAPYLEALAAAQGVPIAAPAIVAGALAGIAADGRPLASLLLLPLLLIKSLIGRGMRYGDAYRRGKAFAMVIASSEVSDAARGGVTVGITAERGYVSVVRFLRLPSCARCIILAGREYSYSDGFARHDLCDCYHLPIHSKATVQPHIPMPEEIFASMSPEDQDKRFGKAGAEAIRLGADMGQVVNARKGMREVKAFGRDLLVTSEGTTVRGIAGKRLGNLKKHVGDRYRRSQIPRLMPEQILAEADGDREEAIRMLHRFGFIYRLPTS